MKSFVKKRCGHGFFFVEDAQSCSYPLWLCRTTFYFLHPFHCNNTIWTLECELMLQYPGGSPSPCGSPSNAILPHGSWQHRWYWLWMWTRAATCTQSWWYWWQPRWSAAGVRGKRYQSQTAQSQMVCQLSKLLIFHEMQGRWNRFHQDAPLQRWVEDCDEYLDECMGLEGKGRWAKSCVGCKKPFPQYQCKDCTHGARSVFCSCIIKTLCTILRFVSLFHLIIYVGLISVGLL